MKLSPTPKEVFVCEKVWGDLSGVRSLTKEAAPKEDVGPDASQLERLRSIPLTNAIYNVLIDPESDKADLCNHQPYVDKGWKIYKLRWQVGRRGAADSIRIIFAVNGVVLVLAHIYPKKPTKRERDLMAEYTHRLKIFCAK